MCAPAPCATVSALIRLDFPTFERPANAISTPFIGGSRSPVPAATAKSQSRREQLAAGFDFGSGEGEKHAFPYICSFRLSAGIGGLGLPLLPDECVDPSRQDRSWNAVDVLGFMSSQWQARRAGCCFNSVLSSRKVRVSAASARAARSSSWASIGPSPSRATVASMAGSTRERAGLQARHDRSPPRRSTCGAVAVFSPGAPAAAWWAPGAASFSSGAGAGRREAAPQGPNCGSRRGWRALARDRRTPPRPFPAPDAVAQRAGADAVLGADRIDRPIGVFVVVADSRPRAARRVWHHIFVLDVWRRAKNARTCAHRHAAGTARSIRARRVRRDFSCGRMRVL